MSFREKSAWATFISLLVVYIPYFIYVYLLAARGQLIIATAVEVFIAGVIVQIVIAIIAHIAISIRSRRDPVDERDTAVQARAFRNAYFVLTFGIFLAAMYMTLAGLLAAAIAIQVVLLCLVCSEATRYATQIVGYRRGI